MKIMSHYLTAYNLYQAAHRDVSWTDALDVHLQRGVVVNVSDFFAMLRPVGWDWSDDWQLDLSCVLREGSCSIFPNMWHVWCVAGDLREMLRMASGYGVEWVSYQRHGQARVRRAEISEFLKRGGAEVARGH